MLLRHSGMEWQAIVDDLKDGLRVVIEHLLESGDVEIYTCRLGRIKENGANV